MLVKLNEQLNIFFSSVNIFVIVTDKLSQSIRESIGYESFIRYEEARLQL